MILNSRPHPPLSPHREERIKMREGICEVDHHSIINAKFNHLPAGEDKVLTPKIWLRI
jgi:hypothetical protein